VNITLGGEFNENQYTVREEPRLREQDWGNFQDPMEIRKNMEERKRFGSFYYRFKNGESGSDVYDRVTDFLGSMNREMKFSSCSDNFVVVSHGITIRAFLMRYFQWTVQEFHDLWNFENCQLAILELQPNRKYKLITKILKSKSLK